MADEQAVTVADSAPADQAALPTDEAAVSADVTHGDATEQAATTDAAAETPDDADDDAETEPSEDDSPEAAQTKAEKRRERRQKREQERIEQAVEERLTARERERETKAQADKAEADAQAAQESWAQEFGSFVGTPDVRQALSAEIATLGEEIANLRPYAEGTDLEVLEQKQTTYAEKVAELRRLNGNLSTYQKLDEFQFKQTQREYAARAASLPDAHRAKMLSSTTVAEALTHLEAGIRADEQAKAKAAADKLTAEWSGKYEKERAAHEATRTGAPGNGPAANGSNGTGGGGGVLTYERYQRMSYDDRQKLRSTPEGRAQIDAMTRNRATAG